jgi:hypothetical protein
MLFGKCDVTSIVNCDRDSSTVVAAVFGCKTLMLVWRSTGWECIDCCFYVWPEILPETPPSTTVGCCLLCLLLSAGHWCYPPEPSPGAGTHPGVIPSSGVQKPARQRAGHTSRAGGGERQCFFSLGGLGGCCCNACRTVLFALAARSVPWHGRLTLDPDCFNSGQPECASPMA